MAQGYITDTITDVLRNEGFESAVVDLGESRTIGRHPDGRPWRVGIRDGSKVGGIDRMVDLADMALAVSGGYGTTFEETGRFHHIFDPRTGASAHTLRDVAVIGPKAMAADGLATAICVAGEALAPTLLAAYPRMRAVLTRLDGTSMTFTGKGIGPGVTARGFEPNSNARSALIDAGAGQDEPVQLTALTYAGPVWKDRSRRRPGWFSPQTPEGRSDQCAPNP
jgi:hypothetical protein